MIFFDVVEELHAILDKEGKAITAEVMGRIECNCRLTGMPDMLVQFNNSDVMDDVSFHPCVRHARYEQDRSLHFIPPDGNFTLMHYRLAPGRNPMPPFYVQPTITFGDGGEGSQGRVTVMCGFRGGGIAMGKQAEDKERNVQEVKIVIPMPQAVDSADCTPTQGKAWFDYATREVVWDIGRLQKAKTSPSLSAVVHLSASEPRPTTLPPVIVEYKLPQVSYSNLKVDSVTLLNEKYKPYKGVRALCRAGKVVVRA